MTETLIPGYDIVSVLGRGDTSTVYHAIFSGRQPVALKVLDGKLISDPDFITHFRQDLKTAASLDHPNIGRVYACGSTDREPYIAAELIEGESLRAVLRRRVVSVEEAVGIIKQVAVGLDYAHGVGMLHRDLKPGNVIIREDGTVALVDFGLARCTRLAALTSPTLSLRRAPYAAPEVCQGREADHRADIYSLGVVLFEMLCGRPPFEGHEPMAVYVQHIKKQVPSILDFRSNLPRRIQRVVERALAKEPDRRYQSAADLAKDLSDAAGIRPEKAAPSAPKLKAPDLAPIGEAVGAAGAKVTQGMADAGAKVGQGVASAGAAAVSGGKAVATGAATTGKAVAAGAVTTGKVAGQAASAVGKAGVAGAGAAGGFLVNLLQMIGAAIAGFFLLIGRGFGAIGKAAKAHSERQAERKAEQRVLAEQRQAEAEERRLALQELRAIQQKEIAAERERKRKLEEERRAEEARLAEERRVAEEARKAELARLAEEKRKEEEARKAAEAARLAEERRVAEEAKRAEQARLAEERRVAEEAKRAELARLAEERRLEQERQAAEAARLAEERRKEEEARKAEQARLAEERRKAEEARQAELARQAEERRLEEERKKAELARIAEEKHREEEARLAEERRLAEEARLAEQARLAEERRLAEEAKKAEQARLAEERRLAEEAKKAEQARLAEERRRADEERRAAEQARQAEERRKAEEARKAEQERLAALKAAEEARRQEESARRAEARRLEAEALEKARTEAEEQRKRDEAASRNKITERPVRPVVERSAHDDRLEKQRRDRERERREADRETESETLVPAGAKSKRDRELAVRMATVNQLKKEEPAAPAAAPPKQEPPAGAPAPGRRGVSTGLVLTGITVAACLGLVATVYMRGPGTADRPSAASGSPKPAQVTTPPPPDPKEQLAALRGRFSDYETRFEAYAKTRLKLPKPERADKMKSMKAELDQTKHEADQLQPRDTALDADIQRELGTLDWFRSDAENARRHWRKAIELNHKDSLAASWLRETKGAVLNE